MIQNIFNRTIINYLLVTIGGLLVGKLGIPGDLWEVFRGALEEAILAGVAGGGLLAIIVGAARGILESQKSKVSVAGQSVPLDSLTPKAQKAIAEEVKSEVALPSKARRSLEDIIRGT